MQKLTGLEVDVTFSSVGHVNSFGKLIQLCCNVGRLCIELALRHFL